MLSYLPTAEAQNYAEQLVALNQKGNLLQLPHDQRNGERRTGENIYWETSKTPKTCEDANKSWWVMILIKYQKNVFFSVHQGNVDFRTFLPCGPQVKIAPEQRIGPGRRPGLFGLLVCACFIKFSRHFHDLVKIYAVLSSKNPLEFREIAKIQVGKTQLASLWIELFWFQCYV